MSHPQEIDWDSMPYAERQERLADLRTERDGYAYRTGGKGVHVHQPLSRTDRPYPGTVQTNTAPDRFATRRAALVGD